MARQTLARDQSAARVEGDMTIPDFEEAPRENGLEGNKGTPPCWGRGGGDPIPKKGDAQNDLPLRQMCSPHSFPAGGGDDLRCVHAETTSANAIQPADRFALRRNASQDKHASA